MSLDVTIKYKEIKKENYFLNHPYTYSHLSDRDKQSFKDEDGWTANITHNLGEMADHIPIIKNDGTATTLYYVCWRPEEIEIFTVKDILPLLIQGLQYMIAHRKELEQFNSPNGWGTYQGFMKFLLNYKEACEDNDPECLIEANR